MNSRERVRMALNHQEPDKIPLDVGAGFQTGLHVQTLYKLRQALKLDSPGTPVKIIEPYQSLGEIKMDLLEALGADVVGVNPPKTLFGFKNEGWKEWEHFDGTPVLVPEAYNTEPEASGDIFMYPEGDKSAPPSGRLPKGGYYFDAIVRQPPLDEEKLKVEDNLAEFGPLSDEEVAYFEREVERLYRETDKAIYLNIGGTAFGDIALVPAPWLKHPRGIRDLEEWYISTVTRQEYVYQVFDRQSEIALANLKRVHRAVGDKVDVIFMSGTDFGSQQAPFMSVETYRHLFLPFHKRLNDWIHQNTAWKTFLHTDGAIMPLMPHFAEAGFDILNPLQWTAKGMEPAAVNSKFGDKFAFWGAGVDTQKTLPFGTPDEVRQEVRQRIEDFKPGGGWVFTSVHNVQPGVPIENLLAMYETFDKFRGY